MRCLLELSCLPYSIINVWIAPIYIYMHMHIILTQSSRGQVPKGGMEQKQLQGMCGLLRDLKMKGTAKGRT